MTHLPPLGELSPAAPHPLRTDFVTWCTTNGVLWRQAPAGLPKTAIEVWTAAGWVRLYPGDRIRLRSNLIHEPGSTGEDIRGLVQDVDIVPRLPHPHRSAAVTIGRVLTRLRSAIQRGEK